MIRITKVFLFFGMACSFLACGYGRMDLHEQRIQESILESTKRGLYQLADTAHRLDTNISSLLNPMVMDAKGVFKATKMKVALELMLKHATYSKAERLPIFEVKNSSKVILPVTGKGLWGKIWGQVLLHKDSMQILAVELDHEVETPSMGSEITKPAFQNQFIGSKIDLNGQSFSLYQDGVELLKGAQRIDGISGATITSKGAVQMLNNDLLKYQLYFDLERQ